MVKKVTVTKPKELRGFGSHGLKGRKGWTGNSPTGDPSLTQKFPRVQVTNFWMSASVTATASQTQTEELAWIPTCLRAVGVPPAAAPPWLPPRLPAVLPRHRAPLPNAPETLERREGDQSEGYLCFPHNVRCVAFPLQQKHHREWCLQRMEKWLLLFLAQRFDTSKASLRTN